MMTKKLINTFEIFDKEIDEIIYNFDSKGESFGNQDRNSLKLFQFNNLTLNVKSFKVPNKINQIVYRYFRKSKAQRSFEYAYELRNKQIGTPQPIGYYEFCTFFFFKKSYYISEHLDYDLTYRELSQDLNYSNHEEILRAFTRFTFNLHENNILFLDHSPGNTLIKRTNDGYDFFLVDLNRMQFKSLNFEERIKNFARLTIHQSMVEVMSDEYAKLINKDYNETFNLMWKLTQEFQAKYHRKIRLKQKLKFWKK